MKIERFGNLHQLTLWPRLFPINCYLYEEQHELTLIDTGMSASFNGIVKEIKNIGKPLTHIVLTHAHGDHVGSLDKLKDRFPEACVSISVRDSQLLKGDKSVDNHEKQTPIRGGVPNGIRTTPDWLLKEGDTVGSLKVIETPGHTPGSIALFDSSNGTIIVGDALQTQGKIAVSGQLVPLFPFPAFGTWDKEHALESAKKIFQLNATLLAVGHGKVMVNPKECLDVAIREAEKKLKRVI